MSIYKPSVPMYPLQSKTWGWTQHIFLSEEVEIARAHIVTGGYCSKHHHSNKVNRFHIINGKLEIIVYRNNKEERVILSPGMTLDVPPMIQHRMVCKEECDFIEIYWSDNNNLNAGDIVRVDDGGINYNMTLFSCHMNKNNDIISK